MKIVSLVPSLTELLIYLGIDVVGRTKFCVFPEDKVANISKVGGTKTVDAAIVAALKPDLVIANKEENVKNQVEDIRVHGIDVLVTEIATYGDAVAAIVQVGKVVNAEAEARKLAEEITDVYKSIEKIDLKVCYLIWKSPWMTVGGDTYISSMLEMFGYTNVFADRKRYPTIELDLIKEVAPDVVFLSSEPFPFKEKHIEEIQSSLPNIEVILVDGTYFSWYGNRMIAAAEYVKGLNKKMNW